MPESWYYFEVPFSDSSQQTPEFGILAQPQPYQAIERFMKLYCVESERRDLVDRARIYRVRNTSIGLFEEDPCNPGVRILKADTKTYTLVDTDPTGSRQVTRDWTPL